MTKKTRAVTKKARKKAKITVSNLVATLSMSELYLRGVRDALMSLDPKTRVPGIPHPDWDFFVTQYQPTPPTRPKPFCVPSSTGEPVCFPAPVSIKVPSKVLAKFEKQMKGRQK
jgi:hypothetical protein